MSRETRKNKVGTIISNKMEDTVIVSVKWQQKHLLYGKAQRRVTKFFAHAASSDLGIGDVVKIEECRPISRLKRWRVVNIIERRELADVKPIELDRELMESYSNLRKTGSSDEPGIASQLEATEAVAEETTEAVAEEATEAVAEEATEAVAEEVVDDGSSEADAEETNQSAANSGRKKKKEAGDDTDV
jgi:small subunit ribosomal protein S17